MEALQLSKEILASDAMWNSAICYDGTEMTQNRIPVGEEPRPLHATLLGSLSNMGVMFYIELFLLPEYYSHPGDIYGC